MWIDFGNFKSAKNMLCILKKLLKMCTLKCLDKLTFIRVYVIKFQLVHIADRYIFCQGTGTNSSSMVGLKIKYMFDGVVYFDLE